MKFAIASLLMLGLASSPVCAQPPEAPIAGSPLKFRLEFKDITVRNLVDIIAAEAKIALEFAPGAQRRLDRVFEKIELEETPEVLLDKIAQMAGLALAKNGKGFRLENNPQAKNISTKAGQGVWQVDAFWKNEAKPFVLTLRLEGKAGEADEVVHELQVGESEAFALTLRVGKVIYVVQGKTANVIQGGDGRRLLPVRLHYGRKDALDSHTRHTRQSLRMPLDETDVALVPLRPRALAPTLSARENPDYKTEAVVPGT